MLFSISNLTAQTIRINEVVSSNSIHTDEDGDSPDWLELHNYGTQNVSINNWSLSDDENDLTQWIFPDIIIAPNEYLLVWASSKDRAPITGNLHTNFNISRSSETLFLANVSGVIVDQLLAENLPPDTSIGVSKISGELVNYVETTPGNENSDNEFIGFIESEVIFSQEGGLISGPISLTLSGNAVGEEIRYTIGGDMPTETSTLYTSPIQINASTSVKAQLFSGNLIPSEVYTKSYIVNANHEIDVMLLTVEPDDFFDEETGIYVFGPEDYDTSFPYRGANFWEDWERPIHFAYYEKEGNNSVEFNGGVKIQGGASRGNEQKSLSLFARGQYGDSEFDYPFFDEISYDKFQALVLRNSGNDWLKSSMKDIMSSSLMRGSGLDFQEHTPVATYLNGEYWGMYNLREKVNEHMLASKHNVDADDITILEFNGREVEGSNAEYLQLRSYIRATDLTIDSNFEFIEQEIDLKEYALYQASQIFFNNTDWPGNNIKYWKHPEGKWRWIMYDTDFGFRDNWSFNTLDWALAENGTGANKEWATLFFRKLVTNIGFRNLFINRYADELNTRFLPSRVNAHIDQIYSTIQPEINRHYQERWDVDPGRVIFYLNEMKTFANNRPAVAKDHIKSKFNLPAYHPITITNPELSEGSVEVNSNLKIQEAFWTGDYFETVPIQLTAMPKAGFEFSHWSGDISSTEQTISLTLVGQIEVTPNFAPTNSNDPIVINEINYKSSASFDTDDWVELYNPNTTAIDISNWQLKDNNDANTFTIPAGTTIDADGYIVLVKTAADFTAVYPDVTNFIGDIGFGFGGSDAVRLFDTSGSLEDEVVYQSGAPWSDCADETGNTLELISPDLDNTLPDSWSCINTNGSPNARNSVTLPSAIVINEINYKSSNDFDTDDWVELYNPNTNSIDLSNWELKDDDDSNSFIIPAGTTIDADGYVVLVKTAADFTAVYPDITNFIGDIDFGFGGSDAVRLFDENGSLQDEVAYQSGGTWSDCADETGNTLELISADLDNALPDSWSCINTNGSPNAENGLPIVETCPSSQIVLSTQQEVDAFSSTYDIANCTFDEGIKIEGAAITNLNGLSGLTRVNGSFDISDSPALNDLSGLSALSIVGGDLQIYNNAALENLNNLSSLTSVGGNMFVSRNEALTDLSGFSALTTVGGGLNISRNTLLSDCDIAFICDATVVADVTTIYQNTGNCVDLDTAEAACTFIPLICPSDEVVLTTQQEVDDFSSIYDAINCTFDEGISIEGADITNLNGLSGIQIVNGKLDISNNPILTDISGLSSLSTVGGNLTISTNASLENLNGLALLTAIGGNMLVNKNALLTDINGLSALTNVGSGLNISKNPLLSNCAIAVICDATLVQGDSNIYSNTGDCVDLATAEAACPVEPDGSPVVDAGENQIIVLLATSSAIFNGTANDPDDGTIVSFEWTQTEGPDTAVFSGENTATLEVTGLINGSYIFRLTATDDQDETGFDEVVLEVQSGTGSVPSVNAGQDQNSTESSITLNGSGSDPDGGDVVFLWTQENGPNTAELSGVDSAELVVSNLVVGEYLFKLTVTDDENDTTFDEVTVTITDGNPVLTCPSSQVVLATQQEVDAFGSIYDVANCTFDEGISIEGADITNLNGLSGLSAVNGRIEISNNPILTDISGLSSLSTLGGNLTISTNASLENLNGLASLTTVGGNMLVNKNNLLTDVIGLAQLTSVGGGLNLSKNPVLSNCEIALVCDATVVAGDTSIYSNTGNCVDLATAEAACAVEPTERPFITTWKTDNPGSSEDNQITIPTRLGEIYNYQVDWGDGTSDTEVSGDISHAYEVPGTYQVSISGDFPSILFNDPFNNGGGDADKILSIDQWGDIEWKYVAVAYAGCNNLDIKATDVPDFSEIIFTNAMFLGCNALVGNDTMNLWDFSSVITMNSMFSDATLFNQDIGNWDVSNVTDFVLMFSNTAFDQNLENWNVSNAEDMGGMFNEVALSNEDYDSLLNGWSTQQLKNGVAFDGGNSQYCQAEEARQKLIDDFGWVITDGGKTVECAEPGIVWLEDFEDLANGATLDNGTTAWTSSRDAGTFAVSNGTFMTSGNSASPGVWTSEVIPISGNISITIDVDDADNRKEPADFVNAYYVLDGGAQILFGSVSDDISPQTFSVSGLSGSSVQIIIESDVSTTNEFYIIDNVTVTRESVIPTTFNLIVDNGLGDGPYEAGTTVNISADDAPSGQEFDNWTGDVASISDVNSQTTFITMPASNTTVTATYRDITSNPVFDLIVDNGIGDGQYEAGTTVNISADDAPSGQEFDIWTGDIVGISNVNNSSTTFTMPETNSSVTATYRIIPTDGIVWLEDFEDLANGATSDNGTTAWTSSRDAGTFAVSNGTFMTSGNSASPGVWTSEVIPISGTISLSIDVDDADNRKEPADFVNVYYVLDGGSQILFGSVSDDISPQKLTVSALSGSTVQIIIESDVSTTNEFYIIDNVTVTRESITPTTFNLIVNNGIGDGQYEAGTTVNISADDAPLGQEFVIWTGDVASVLDVNSQATFITMPGSNTTVTANYRDITSNLEFDLTVNNGIGDGQYEAGTTVNISADDTPLGQEFDIWTGDVIGISDVNNPTTTFIMPETNSTVTATYRIIPTDGVVWLEDFEDLANGATSDNGTTAWTSSRDAGTFAVSNGTFMTSGNSASPGVWTSEVILISGNISITIDVDDADNRKEPADFVNAYYVLDGGQQVLFGSVSDDISAQTFSINALSGSTIQIIIESDVSTTNEFYLIDNVSVTTDGGSSKNFSGSPFAENYVISNNETLETIQLENVNDNFKSSYIYPNPTSDFLGIRHADSNVEILTIRLFDLNGKLVHTYDKSKIYPNQGGFEIPIERVENGVYMIQVNFNNGEPFYYKVVVQN